MSKIDLAFSRDQAEKFTFSTRCKQTPKAYLNGLILAYFYVCGDASRMAHDVDQALHSIIQKQAGISEEVPPNTSNK